jgi:hypothetical protein
MGQAAGLLARALVAPAAQPLNAGMRSGLLPGQYPIVDDFGAMLFCEERVLVCGIVYPSEFLI